MFSGAFVRGVRVTRDWRVAREREPQLEGNRTVVKDDQNSALMGRETRARCRGVLRAEASRNGGVRMHAISDATPYCYRGFQARVLVCGRAHVLAFENAPLWKVRFMQRHGLDDKLLVL